MSSSQAKGFVVCYASQTNEKVVPRERNQKRISNVLSFMSSEDTPQYLRRTSLVLGMVSHVHSVCAQLHAPGEPLLVQLSKRRVCAMVGADFSRLISSLHLDDELDVAACLSLALGVATDLVLRFRHYVGYPFVACQLCRKFNGNFRLACLDFLSVPDSELDAGFSLPLKRLAFGAGDTAAAWVSYLLSDAVQSALELAFSSSAASSLPVERKFAETKRNEAPRLCHVAVASRNQLLRSFYRERDQHIEALAAAASAALVDLQLI